jgi:hypothetical protein
MLLLAAILVTMADDPTDILPFRDAVPHNAVSGLDTSKLIYEPEHGYLRSLLELLKIPVSSQVLVFTKTSFQATKISPRIPRAIYHSDDAFIGWVRGGDVIEIAVTDPQLGIAFYTLDQEQVRKPRIERRGQECLQCHAGASTQGVPGLLVRSVVPDRSGMPVTPGPSYVTDHRSPLDQRWGGWYVTGTHGDARHMGNSYVEKGDPASAFDASPGFNRTNLDSAFTTTPYLAASSDIVSLLVLEHRIRVINTLIRASFEERIRGHASPATLERAARALRMDDEAALPSPVKGSSTFAEDYRSEDPERRALDLQTRLYRNKKSPMLSAPVFLKLPAAIQTELRRAVAR